MSDALTSIINDASTTARVLSDRVRSAHSVACGINNIYAELLLRDLVEKVAGVQQRLGEIQSGLCDAQPLTRPRVDDEGPPE